MQCQNEYINKEGKGLLIHGHFWANDTLPTDSVSCENINI